MQGWEALKALKQGEKIRRAHWPKANHVCYTDISHTTIAYDTGENVPAIPLNWLTATDWEIAQKTASDKYKELKEMNPIYYVIREYQDATGTHREVYSMWSLEDEAEISMKDAKNLKEFRNDSFWIEK